MITSSLQSKFKRDLDQLFEELTTRETAVKTTESEFHKYERKAKLEIEQLKVESEEKAESKGEAIVSAATEAAALVKSEAEIMLSEVQEEKEAWEEEKQRLAHIQQFKSRVKLDVGGFTFTTTRVTLCRFPDSMLGAMFSGRHEVETDEDGVVFIDRDGTHFRHILNFLRNPENFAFDIPGAEQFEMKREAIYYGLICEMFPPIVLKDSTYNVEFYAFQDKAGLWYFKKKDGTSCTSYRAPFGDDDYLATLCRSCGCAFVFIERAKKLRGAVNNFLSIVGGHLHNQSQPYPSPTEICPHCQAKS